MKPFIAARCKEWLCAPFAALLLVNIAEPARASPFVDIQPVNICLDDGTSCGTIIFDADAVKAYYLDKAGITLNFLPTRTFNSTTFQTMDNIGEVESLIFANPSFDPAGPPGPGYSSAPITAWFSKSALSTGELNLSLLPGNRTWIATDVDPFADSFQSISVAQSIGVNLGLSKIFDFTGDLMDAHISTFLGLNDLGLSEAQVALMRASTFVYDGPLAAEVPLPAAFPLFAAGLGVMGLLGWRRKRKLAANAA